MTCIVGLIDNGVAYIGGERGASTDATIMSIAEPKVWKHGEYLFGYYGTFMGERLKYNFYPYILKGQEETKQKLRHAQIKSALSGNATMLIWLGKNILGQSDSPLDSEANQPLPWSDDE